MEVIFDAMAVNEFQRESTGVKNTWGVLKLGSFKQNGQERRENWPAKYKEN